MNRQAEAHDDEPMHYPENHVIGIVDTPEPATAARHDLTGDRLDPLEVEPAGIVAAEAVSCVNERG
jgi:hypothetical protein